jgi:outer membrane protein assembly factor BamB
MLTASKKRSPAGVLIVMIGLLASSHDSTCKAGDWPQWRGPNRDGICTETNLLTSWPESGPKLLWELAGLGKGYSSLAIVDDRFYTMGDVPVGSETVQCILAYDLATRERLWIAKVGKRHSDGPRCTPTVDNGLIYAVGTEGNVVCVSADNGEQRWSKNLQKDLGGGKSPGWRFSESPLVDGEKLLCTPGGRSAVMAALDKRTGDVVWKSSMPDIGPKGKDEAGYSSIIAADIVGVRQYVQLTNKGLVGVAAEDGEFLWGYNPVANKVANISTPVVCGDSVFCSTAYGTGSALVKLTNAGDGVSANEVYFLDADTFQNHHGGFVRIGEHIYGGHGHGKGKPTCVEVKTGKVMWQADQPGGGSAAVLYADGHLYFRYQDDVLALIEANPYEYKFKSKFKLPKRKGMSGNGWAHPVIVDGRLYVRHADVLLVYDVKG